MFRTDRKYGRIGRRFRWPGLFLTALTLQLLARYVPGFAEGYAVFLYPAVMRTLGTVSGWFPFALDEILIYLMVFGALGYAGWGIRCIRRQKEAAGQWGRRTVAGILKVCVFWFFAFTITCGINYHRTAFSRLAGLPAGEATAEELEELCWWLTGRIEEVCGEIRVGDDGLAALPEDMREKTRTAMTDLGDRWPQLAGWYPKAKPVLTWKLLSMEFLEGIFGPYTMEAHYNPDIPAYNQPAVLCHELSHLKGFMREDEANYIAYLACTGSEDANLRYSGLLLAYTHSINALYRADQERFQEVRSRLCEQAERDYAWHRSYWAQYRGPVSEISDKVNDTYLRINSQQEGSRSYGRMVDLLVGEYRQTKEETDG